MILDDGDGNPDGDGAYRKGEGLNPHEGTIAIVAGHGGAGVSRSGTMPIMREIILEHGSVILDIDGDTLTGTMVDKHGDTRDVFALEKRGTVTVSRVENPWQPKGDLDQITEMLLEFKDDEIGSIPKNWHIDGTSDSTIAVAEREGDARMMSVSAVNGDMIATWSPWSLTEFEIETLVRMPEGDHIAGMVFAFIDDDNYSRAELDSRTRSIRIINTVDGKDSLVHAREADFPFDTWMKLELETSDGQLEVQLQDKMEYFTNPGKLGKGPCGIYVKRGSKADFAYFEVQK